ncbi:MAG TPA: PilC/PilY family type IV pilus protein [Steroidobacteraceae bacterium]|nr:PilC/PilY family type IV pilus protein [Steroidobacteraceae bacterium]
MKPAFRPKRFSVLCCSALLSLLAFSAAQAAPLSLADTPLFLNGTVAPLNLLVIGRDHKLYYEAYNDHSDLDGDGVPDVGYKPDKITYYGYFDSFKCYTYNSGSNRFEPKSTTANKKCDGSTWSGDWLNYVTTSRIDALRKVLYGGLRRTDNDTETVLERAYIPQDAHSWGKSYESIAKDGYDIHEYTPLNVPSANSSHLFANTTLRSDANNYPLLRVLQNQQDSNGNPLKVWNWLSIERPVAGSAIVVGTSNGAEVRKTVSSITDYRVRVKVCDPSVGTESNCRAYTNGSGGTNFKPTGLLQDFGEQDLMKFGLITGSYAKNTDGGVLRRAMGSIKNEINSDGTINTSVTGIIRTLDGLRTTGFNTDYSYKCGWKVSGPIAPGECQMWGNPIAEMMYEGIRYFAGKKKATPEYAVAFGQGEESELPGGGLPVATWDDPYANAPSCAKPFETVISDINPSYDSDKLPGTAFGSFSGDISDLDVAALGQTIWDNEIGGSKKYYIGRSLSDAANDDKAPTPKTVTSFGNIRGLAPEEPTKEGSYYAASVAYYGLTHDVNGKTGNQNVSTFAVALASPLPRIEIPVGDKKITLVPFAKTVGGSVNGSNVSASSTGFQPTNQIVDFYVDTLEKNYGKFRVNYEDVEQGADHDMDAIVQYEYTVKDDGTVDITLTSQYAAGSLIQHIGYVISGTTHDGIYFDVRDTDTAANSDPDYYLDTPPGFTGTPPAPGKGQSGTWNDGTALPLVSTRTFTPGATSGADLLKDPLWYAAKWGGFKDQDKNGVPNLQDEWDENHTGDPSNYFLVTNALTLPAQLSKAFNEIIVRTSAAASASVNSGSVSSDTRVYQAKFSSGDWSGQLLSFPLNTDGTLKPFEWDAATKLPAPTDRTIITTDSSKNPVAFRWSAIGSNRQKQLDPAAGTLGSDRLDYLRGDDSKEASKPNGIFRKRVTKLGDIVNSAPIFVGAPPFRYSDASYATFRTTWADRPKMVYVGANDGMLHGFDATSGVERLAFIPGPVFGNLAQLTSNGYAHRFYVDGTPSMADVYYNGAWHTVLVGGLNNGGQGIYALDVTDPAKFSEANAASIYKWEFTDADDADLGYTYSRPAIAQFRSPTGTQWLAVFGNGYNSTFDDTAKGGKKSATGNAVLFFVDIETGKLVAKIDTKMGMGQDPSGNSRPNGLATPTLVDINGDNVVDYVFAGDLFGEMWKFDVTAADPTSWNIAFGGVPLFVAKDAGGKNQPITTRAEVGRGPGGKGMVVLFGTGKFLEPSDKVLANLSTQSFYGLFDPNTPSTTPINSNRSTLTKQAITFEGTNNVNGKDIPLRGLTQNAVAANSRGWYLDFISPAPGVPTGSIGFKGEMQVSDPILRNGRVIFSTIIPNTDPCTFGGTSWLMSLDALSGGRLSYPPFDLDNDHLFTDTDFITLPDGTKIPASGMQWTEGMVGKPGVVAGQNEDFGYGSGSSGNDPEKKNLNTGPGDRGRQSWRQLR